MRVTSLKSQSDRRVLMICVAGLFVLAGELFIASVVDTWHVTEIETIVAGMSPDPKRQATEARRAAAGAHAVARAADETAFFPSTEAVDATRALGQLAAVAPPPVEGVFPSDTPLYRNFEQTTFWQGWVGEFWYEVHAGASTEDPAAGLLYWSEPLPNGPAYKAVPAPARDGALTIVSAEKGVLTIRSASGAIFLFDVKAGAFR